MINRVRHLVEEKKPMDRVVVINKITKEPYLGYVERIEYNIAREPYYYVLIWNSFQQCWQYACDPMYWELV